MKMRRVWGRMDLVRRRAGMLALGLVGVGLLNRQNCNRFARSMLTDILIFQVLLKFLELFPESFILQLEF
jgi:hypothetical protein